MQELRASRTYVDQSDIVGTSLSEAVEMGPAKGNLQTGERVAIISSKPLSQGGRSNISFRVVGEDLFGWAEAAVLWGGTVDFIIHRQQDKHRING